MSTSKHIDRICCIILAFALVLTAVFVNGESLGLVSTPRTLGYEDRLFDADRVHTIDIVMDDWEGFIEGCEDESYHSCNLVIDGEAFKNIAIRAKGNTSLTMVSSMDSDRYSFKLEFDHYDSTKSYYGLDKLSLNNLIQDNTMMKDFLVYQMMNRFGVHAPLCSFTYITVNGEDWGLYLAVESVEDAFLMRNYGSDPGNLYKPDTTMNGGGRGNGQAFDMDTFLSELIGTDSEDSEDSAQDSSFQEMGGPGKGEGSMAFPGNGGAMPAPGEENGGAHPAPGESFPARSEESDEEDASGEDKEEAGTVSESEESGDENAQTGEDGSPAENENRQMPEGSFEGMTPPAGMEGGMTPPAGMEGDAGRAAGSGSGGGPGGGGGHGSGGGMGGMGSDDVKLQYIDDEIDSYSNIFNNAKTDISDSDKERLIASLKTLSSYEDLESVLDMDQVLRYFVVHNFVCNGDSYTGSMIHNYYLYEKDGELAMIPWDYNLAFGAFQNTEASSTVNEDIDEPVSGGDNDDRPMVGWIFSDESYTERYHELFDEFLADFYENDSLLALVDSTAELIAPYVEKDPTRFCTYEEFETGVETLKTFLTLRSEAVLAQLSGDETPIDTGDLEISDMGSMSMGGMGGPGFGGQRMGEPGFGGTEMSTPGGADGMQSGDGADDTVTEGSSGEESSREEENASGENAAKDSQNTQTAAEAQAS